MFKKLLNQNLCLISQLPLKSEHQLLYLHFGTLEQRGCMDVDSRFQNGRPSMVAACLADGARMTQDINSYAWSNGPRWAEVAQALPAAC